VLVEPLLRKRTGQVPKPVSDEEAITMASRRRAGGTMEGALFSPASGPAEDISRKLGASESTAQKAGFLGGFVGLPAAKVGQAAKAPGLTRKAIEYVSKIGRRAAKEIPEAAPAIAAKAEAPIVRTIKGFGITAVRGSSTRGWITGLKGVLRTIKAGRDIAITPDGPKGPAMKAQMGIIQIARATGLPIVPVSFGASKKKPSGAGIPS
ncbi:MAG: DUF374 domain-containing protein, partial [Deltaproteobacteria bacterium]